MPKPLSRRELICIHALEMAPRPWGRESRDHLRRITPPTITLRRLDSDRYGRIVEEVYAGADATAGEPLNLALVSAGQAAVYRGYCSDWRYYAAQDPAWDAGLGVWARTGEQQRPRGLVACGAVSARAFAVCR